MIVCLDAVARKGCRIWGQAEVLTSGELLEVIDKEFTGINMEVKHVVTMAVEEIETFLPGSGLAR